MLSPHMADLEQAQKTARTRLSENLKRLRGEQGMSQEGLGDRAGLHRTYVSQVERRMVNISLDNIVQLAEALGVDVVDLLAAPGPPAPVEQKGPRKRTAEKD